MKIFFSILFSLLSLVYCFRHPITIPITQPFPSHISKEHQETQIATIFENEEYNLFNGLPYSSKITERKHLLNLVVVEIEDKRGNAYSLILDTGSSDCLIYSSSCYAQTIDLSSSTPCPSTKYNPTTNNAIPYTCQKKYITPTKCEIGEQMNTTNVYGGGNRLSSSFWIDEMKFIGSNSNFVPIHVGATYHAVKPVVEVDGLFGFNFKSRSKTRDDSMVNYSFQRLSLSLLSL